MKKFSEKGEYFVLSSYQIMAVPIADDSRPGITIAKTICEDACYLSADGNGQTSIEILRIAGKKAGSRIGHILTVRTHDSSEQDCVIRQEALLKGILSMLHQRGYIFEELTYSCYRKYISSMESEAVWSLIKKDIREYGVHETYVSPSITEDVDWEKIYSALDGSGCSLCIQIVPSLLSDNECRLIANSTAQYSQAVDGVVPYMRDSLAAVPAGRWKYFAQEALHSFAEVNILIMGSVSAAALVTVRVKQSVHNVSFYTAEVPHYSMYSIYNQPWKIAYTLRKADNSKFRKWTSDEVARIFQLPIQNDFFIGVKENAFSLLPEINLLPEQLTCFEKQKIHLGKSVFSSQNIFIPFGQLLLHTALMGKTGVGKTTLLKQIISRLHECDIPVLIMEPVKREYRDLVAGMKKSRIFTVERPITPLLINPFCVPEGVPLGEYRSSLLSAFKAAFSLPDPLPSLFEKAISEAYILNGWTDVSMSSDADVTIFDMAEFIRVFKSVIARSNYSNEVKGNMMAGGAFRLQSIIERCPHTFDTLHSTSVKSMLNDCVVLEMGCLEPEQKSLVSALTLIRILAYLKAVRKSSNCLQNIIVIDEAHALLDQGESATEEEKALNNTMTQLMINVITEIRAYGVGIIFSDQSPSRIGGRLLDNVDNIISFRLSGEEAETLKTHIGEENTVCNLLPLLSTGDFVFKNRFLKSVLPMRMEYSSREIQKHHVSDDWIAKAQMKSLAAHAKEYRPFSMCESTGCEQCTASVREKANMYAVRIFAEVQRRLKTPEEIAAQIMRIPFILSSHLPVENTALFEKICNCTAVHLLRKCLMENGISFSRASIARLLPDMNKNYRREGIDTE